MLEENLPRLRRRTLVRGAAWALPAISAVMAVPQAVASSSPARRVIIVPECGGRWRWYHDMFSNKTPSTEARSAYRLTVTVTDRRGEPVSGAVVTATSTNTQSDDPCNSPGLRGQGFSALYFTSWKSQKTVGSEQLGPQAGQTISDAAGDASFAVYTGRGNCPGGGRNQVYSSDFLVTVQYPDGENVSQTVPFTLQGVYHIPTRCG